MDLVYLRVKNLSFFSLFHRACKYKSSSSDDFHPEMNERVKLFPMIDILRRKIFSCNIWKESKIWSNKLYSELSKVFLAVQLFIGMKYYENNFVEVTEPASWYDLQSWFFETILFIIYHIMMIPLCFEIIIMHNKVESLNW